MTTSAPQWPGQEGIHEPREADRHPRGRQAVRPSPVRELPGRVTRAGQPAQERQPASHRRAPLRAVPDTTLRRLQPLPSPSAGAPTAPPTAPPGELRVVRRARAKLPSPAAVTRDIALALLEVEAGCRSAASWNGS